MTLVGSSRRCGPKFVETEMGSYDSSQVMLDLADAQERFSDILEQDAQVRAGYEADDSLRFVSHEDDLVLDHISNGID